MKRLTMCGMLAAIGTALLSVAVPAQQPETSRVGIMGLAGTYEEGLRDGLRELGYVEGKTITFERRRSTGTAKDLRSVASDLGRSKVHVVVAFSTPAARAALETAAAPVVFLSSDPVPSGLAASLARPGGNATGVSLTGPDLTAKRLEYLRLLAPRVRRIGCLVNISNPVGALQFESAQSGARTLGLDIVRLPARNDIELEASLQTIRRGTVDGILVTGDAFLLANRTKIGAALRKVRLPAITPTREYLGDGAVISYGPSLRDAGRMMAVYVDKILKGARPGDIPIEQVSNYELVLDVRAAQSMRLKVPQELLMRANEIVR